MDALALVDTFGVLSPHAVQFLVRETRKRIDKRLEAHFHMDFGMGVANTLIAVAEGVEVIHSTVLGIGERAGNTPMEEAALALQMLYGVDTGLKYEKFYDLARLVEKFSGHRIPTNRPVVGEQLFQIESGIIASWWMNCGKDHPTELFPYHWDVVGQPAPRIVIGKGSGIDSIKVKLEELGIEVSAEDSEKVLANIKLHSVATKKLLTDEEVLEVVKATVERQIDCSAKT
jgi:isopropylmalate/homocitrate/citramalate synthase